MFFGSHLIGSQVKQTKINTPVGTVNQSNRYDKFDNTIIPKNVIDQEPKLKLGNDKPVWPLAHGNDMFEDSYKRGHNQWGGYGNLMGKGFLGQGLENYEKSRSVDGKEPFAVPAPRQSFELERRLKIRDDYGYKISKDQYIEDCSSEHPKTVASDDILTGFVHSHQRGYRSTTRGAHDSGLGYRIVNGKFHADSIKATFQSDDKEQVRYDDPNKWANQYTAGYQKFKPYDGYGVPNVRDGPDSILLQSRVRVPDVVKLPTGYRTGGYRTGYQNLRRPQHLRSQE